MDEGINANDEFHVSPSVSQSVLAGGGRYFDLMMPTALLEAEMYPDPKKSRIPKICKPKYSNI